MSSHNQQATLPSMSDSDNTLSFSTRGDNSIENMGRTMSRLDVEESEVIGVNVELILDGSLSERKSKAKLDDAQSSSDGSSNGSSDSGSDASRTCPNRGTYKHAALEMLSREDAHGDKYVPSSVLQERYSEYGMDRMAISNALGELFRSDRMVERMRNRMLPDDEVYDGVDHQEYCYTLVDAAIPCLESIGSYPRRGEPEE